MSFGQVCIGTGRDISGGGPGAAGRVARRGWETDTPPGGDWKCTFIWSWALLSCLKHVFWTILHLGQQGVHAGGGGLMAAGGVARRGWETDTTPDGKGAEDACLCVCVCVCESYIGKLISTRAVPQFTTGVAKPLTQI